MKKIILAIDGMTCSACSNGLEKYLNKQKGIISASVNLVMANALIEYDEKILDQVKIEKFIEEAGFEILQAEEAFLPIKFYDVGAFVWFARIIEWEFPGFSVDGCFEKLLEMQKIIEETGEIAGTTHRYLIVARK